MGDPTEVKDPRAPYRELDAAVEAAREKFPNATECKPIYANGRALVEVWEGPRAGTWDPES